MNAKKYDVSIILKNGFKIDMRVENMTCETNRLNGSLVSITYNGVADNNPLFIDINQVAAVIQRLDAGKEEQHEEQG